MNTFFLILFLSVFTAPVNSIFSMQNCLVNPSSGYQVVTPSSTSYYDYSQKRMNCGTSILSQIKWDNNDAQKIADYSQELQNQGFTAEIAWGIALTKYKKNREVDRFACVTIDGSFHMIIQDSETLRPYYKAIQDIRKILELECEKFDTDSGFTRWPSPNPYVRRTPQYFYLETMAFRGKEVIVGLYTPFGEVKLVSADSGSERSEISKNFLATMDWELEEVTQKVNVYYYVQDENFKNGPFKFKETREYTGVENKLYLIKSVNGKNFYEKDLLEKDELMIFEELVLAKGQYEKDGSQFKELSQGKNCFSIPSDQVDSTWPHFCLIL